MKSLQYLLVFNVAVLILAAGVWLGGGLSCIN